MSTYEEFMIIINVALLIIAILNYTHKKIAVLPLVSVERLFFVKHSPERMGLLHRADFLVKYIIIKVLRFFNTILLTLEKWLHQGSLDCNLVKYKGG